MISKLKPYRATADEAIDILNHIYERCPVLFQYDVMIGDSYQIICTRTKETIVSAYWDARDQNSVVLAINKDFL